MHTKTKHLVRQRPLSTLLDRLANTRFHNTTIVMPSTCMRFPRYLPTQRFIAFSKPLRLAAFQTSCTPCVRTYRVTVASGDWAVVPTRKSHCAGMGVLYIQHKSSKGIAIRATSPFGTEVARVVLHLLRPPNLRSKEIGPIWMPFDDLCWM